MTINDKTKDEKLKCDINREAAKHQRRRNTGEEILSSDKKKIKIKNRTSKVHIFPFW